MKKQGLYNDAIAAKICELVATGIGLGGACTKLNLSRGTVQYWATMTPAFDTALQRAKRAGFEVWADEIISIGDEIEGCTDNAQVQAAKVRIESRKWTLARLHPEQWGDRVAITGKDGKDLLPATSEVLVPRLLSVISVLLPGKSNSELYSLAQAMVQRLNGGVPRLEGSEDGTDPD